MKGTDKRLLGGNVQEISPHYSGNLSPVFKRSQLGVKLWPPVSSTMSIAKQIRIQIQAAPNSYIDTRRDEKGISPQGDLMFMQ